MLAAQLTPRFNRSRVYVVEIEAPLSLGDEVLYRSALWERLVEFLSERTRCGSMPERETGW